MSRQGACREVPAPKCQPNRTGYLVFDILELYRAYGELLGAFRVAAEKLRAGVRDVVFPAGSFPPALPWVSG